MKHLLLLGTGGTIACKRGENGLTPLLTGDELLSYVPDAKKFCEVETVQVLNIDSTNMHPKHIERLSKNECNPSAGVVFLDILSNLERISDHAYNVAGYVKDEL